MLFALASRVIAPVDTAGVRLAARPPQGLAAALAVPASLAIAVTAVAAERRAIAVAAWAARASRRVYCLEAPV